MGNYKINDKAFFKKRILPEETQENQTEAQSADREEKVQPAKPQEPEEQGKQDRSRTSPVQTDQRQADRMPADQEQSDQSQSGQAQSDQSQAEQAQAERKQTRQSQAGRKPADQQQTGRKPTRKAQGAPKAKKKIPKAVKVRREVTEAVKASRDMLVEAGMPQLAAELEKLYKTVCNERFSVAMVGEFNRGKSTFINRMLGQKIVPEGALPTTSLLTKIYASDKNVLTAFDETGKRIRAVPLSEEAWEGLTAENFGEEEFRGFATVGVRSEWLAMMGIEIIDTPGAGDLEASRMKVIEEALLGCNGAIITIDATNPLSRSEQIFIQERLITRKTPFLMMIVTKLDLVELEERQRLLRYLRKKLKMFKQDIPMYVAYEVEMEDDSFQNIFGMDKIKGQMENWLLDPSRRRMTEEWILARTLSVLDMAIETQRTGLAVAEEADGQKQETLLKENRAKLSEAQKVWAELCSQMTERGVKCHQLLVEKAEEYKGTITERMQYEAAHTQSPEKWWAEDYPYRLRVELSNMAVGIDNLVSRQVAEDTGWFNQALAKTFKSGAAFEKQTVMDHGFFKDFRPDLNLKLEDMNRSRNITRIGTTALTIGGALFMSSIGAFPLVATMGIGTGANIITEGVFKRKIEDQKNEIKKVIALTVPRAVEEALEDSEKRLRRIYGDIVQEAKKSEQLWLDTQNKAIEEIRQNVKCGKTEQYTALLEKLQNQKTRIETL